MGISEAFAAHQAEMAGMPPPAERERILLAWRRALDVREKAYADLVAAHPRRDDLLRLEAECILQAWLCGHMARRGWVTDAEARQAVFMLGRMLRNRVRAAGVPIEAAGGNVATTIDATLLEIVKSVP